MFSSEYKNIFHSVHVQRTTCVHVQRTWTYDLEWLQLFSFSKIMWPKNEAR